MEEKIEEKRRKMRQAVVRRGGGGHNLVCSKYVKIGKESTSEIHCEFSLAAGKHISGTLLLISETDSSLSRPLQQRNVR